MQLPFRVHPIVEEIGKSRVEYTIQIKANFNPKLNANNVVLKIPTPLNTTKVDCKVQLGKAKYVPAENLIIWKCVAPVSRDSGTARRLRRDRQDPPHPRPGRYDVDGRSVAIVDDDAETVVPTADQPRLPGAHVHVVGLAGPVLEGV